MSSHRASLKEAFCKGYLTLIASHGPQAEPCQQTRSVLDLAFKLTKKTFMYIDKEIHIHIYTCHCTPIPLCLPQLCKLAVFSQFLTLGKENVGNYSVLVIFCILVLSCNPFVHIPAYVTACKEIFFTHFALIPLFRKHLFVCLFRGYPWCQ